MLEDVIIAQRHVWLVPSIMLENEEFGMVIEALRTSPTEIV
jgi:hypothetical protein